MAGGVWIDCNPCPLPPNVSLEQSLFLFWRLRIYHFSLTLFSHHLADYVPLLAQGQASGVSYSYCLLVLLCCIGHTTVMLQCLGHSIVH